jgi:phosphatidylserine/phosphatidylglycerophosphate/cardiolipin synthase-like enzyme
MLAEADGTWVELLLTDSLDRPLESAPYALERGEHRETGRLAADGRVSFELPPRGARLFICHRTLVLLPVESQGLAWDRDRLTNLGYDAGPPILDPHPERVRLAFQAFLKTAPWAGDDPRSLLDAWYRGAAGLAQPAPAAGSLRLFRRGFFGRWRARRAALRGAPRSGSHLASDALQGGRVARLAVRSGRRGSPEAVNRIAVFDWFSGMGTPPRAGNLAELLVDGEEAWGRAAADLGRAERELCLSTWFADPDIELRRPMELAIANPDRRAELRFAAIVEALAERGGRTSILLWNWVMTPIVHPTLRRWATGGGDRVALLQLAHPKLFGSFHQKTMIVDRAVGYCGGFNLRQNDWDTQAHDVADPRRNPHHLSGWERRTTEPCYPPRHDVAVRVEGPIVADLHDNFVRQWNAQIRRERHRVRQWFGRLLGHLLGGGPATALAPIEIVPEPRGTVLAQLVRTDPVGRLGSQAIVDVYLRAILNARRLIYIENQFFRSPRIAGAIARALAKHPKLEVVVVTNRVGPPLRALNPTAYWTRLAQQTIRAERPDFTLYELMARGELEGALVYRPIWVHAKIMIIDDEWVTAGSANINDRSISTEFEANVAVDDPLFAARTRRRLMGEHLGLSPDDARLVDPLEAVALWRTLARDNADARREHRPARGLAHPFEQAGAFRWLRGRSEWF